MVQDEQFGRQPKLPRCICLYSVVARVSDTPSSPVAKRLPPQAANAPARWYSEALLPSAFLARFQGDPLAESWTHADGVIGHFEIGMHSKTGLSLLPDAHYLVVLEAKLFSPLASGVTNAPTYDQAARTVACIAEILHRANRQPSEVSHLGFYVLAPQSQIAAGAFDPEMTLGSIRDKVQRRVAAYAGEKDTWYADWFDPTLDRIDIAVLSWEGLLDTVAVHDPLSAGELHEFYERCLRFNRPPFDV